MPHWVVDNIYAYLQGASEQEQASLYNLLRVRPKNYFFDYRYKLGVWDGYEYYFDRSRQRILTGLLDLVDEMGFQWPRKYTVNDPIKQLQDPALLDGRIYADKQQSAIDKVRAGANRGIFDMIMGFGKASILSGIVKMLNCPTVVIVPGISLLSQVHDELQKLTGLKCGRIGGGYNEEDALIKIVIDDTLKRLPDWRLERIAADAIAVHMDEVHNCTKLLHRFLTKCTNAYYRYGYSATPFDMGKARAVDIIGMFGGVLETATSQDLIDAKRGVPAHFVFVEISLPKSGASDYTALYDDCVTNNTMFHNQVADLVEKEIQQPNTSVLILVKRLQHGSAIAAALKQRKIPATFTHGKQQAKHREHIKGKFKGEEIKVLIASDIYKEGVDIPCIDVVVMATAGESAKDWRQRIGRGLRTHPGKDFVTVYDFLFKGNKIFEEHSNKRLKRALELEGSQVFKLNQFLDQPVLIAKTSRS